MSSTRKQQVAERVLDSVRTRFGKDVSNAWNGIDVRRQLHSPAALGTDQDALFKTKHELFQSGLEAWLESLVKITQEWVSRLARIASRNPTLATDDPARWSRCRVQEMLGEALGIVVIGPDAAVPTSFQVNKVRSAIERWITHVCEDGLDFDRSESGYDEPWCAPVWMISFGIRKVRPDRLTVEQTELVVRGAENMFIGRLDYVLGDAEDQARVDLADEYQLGSHSTAAGREDPASDVLDFAAKSRSIDAHNGDGARQSLAVARRPQTRKRSNQAVVRDAVMFAAIKQDLRGIVYCRFLYDNKQGPSPKWVSDGCPKSYVEAYDKGMRWRQRIQDEKYRAGVKLRRMEQFEPKELEKLLGIAARATR
jgi:hypothetical protein